MEKEKKLLLLHSYCVYHRGNIYSDFPQYRHIFELQLRTAFQRLNVGDYDVLIISGGYTKKDVEKSEARGMLDWAEDFGLSAQGKIILLEEYAHDSLENLLFSMCRFFQYFNGFPVSVGSLTWQFNKERHEIFARKLALPDFQVILVGERERQEEIAKKWAKLAEDDPFYQKQPDSNAKYLRRDPWKKDHSYDKINGDFQRLFAKLAEIKEQKGILGEATDFYPWN